MASTAAEPSKEKEEFPSKQNGCKLLVAYSDTSEEEEEERKPERRSISSIDSDSDSSSSTSTVEESSSSTSSSDDDTEESETELSSDIEHLPAGPDDTTRSPNSKKKLTKDKPERLPGKTKGELALEDLPPIEDLKISVEQAEIQHAGHVFSIVGCLVIIQTVQGTPALDLDTMLFFENGSAFGQVFDVFGPVKQPLYTVRFNCKKDIEDKRITVKMPIYYAPQKNEFTSFIFAEQLRRMKGCDASWKNDNEPPEDFVDYSDDEQEILAKSRRKGKKNYVNLENCDADVPFSNKRRNFGSNIPMQFQDSRSRSEDFYSAGDPHARNVSFIRPPTFHYPQKFPRDESMSTCNPAAATRCPPPAQPPTAMMPAYGSWKPTFHDRNMVQGNAYPQTSWNARAFRSPPPPPPPFTSPSFTMPVPMGPSAETCNYGELGATHALESQNSLPMQQGFWNPALCVFPPPPPPEQASQHSPFAMSSHAPPLQLPGSNDSFERVALPNPFLAPGVLAGSVNTIEMQTVSPEISSQNSIRSTSVSGYGPQCPPSAVPMFPPAGFSSN